MTMKINEQIACMVMVAIVVLAACSKKKADEAVPETPSTTVTVENVSYANFAKGLFETKCAGCHANGAPASGRWTFSGFSSVRDNSARINNVVLVTKSMPRGGSLTDQELVLLKAWFDRNTPEN